MAALSISSSSALTQKAFNARTPLARPKALARVTCRELTPAPSVARMGLSVPRTNQSRQTVITAASTVEPVTQENGTVYADFLDEEAMLAASTFPIKPDDLVATAKAWLMKATDGQYDETSMAETFEFAGPVVGPLSKEQFLTAIGSFDLKEGIPDLTGNMHHFRVDPYIHNRVWFTTIAKGTHTGTLAGQFKATGTAFQSPPQSCSLTFNEDGQVIQYTIGYAMDRRLGSTGGLGGVFGIFYAIGKPLPFPEANPWKISNRYKFFQLLGKVNAMLKKK